MNQKYPNIRAIWNIQEMSDIGSGISARKNRAVYANTAGDIVAVDLSSGTKIWSYPTGGKSTPHLRSMGTGWFALQPITTSIVWTFNQAS